MCRRGVFRLLAAGLFLGGCADETTQVVVPEYSTSVFVLNDNEAVTMGWTPWLNGTPDEIDVHRGTQADFSPSVATLLATLPGTATQYVDSDVVNGAVSYYRLVPVALSAEGQRNGGASTVSVPGRPFDYSAVTVPSYADIQAIFNSTCAVHGCHVGQDDVTPDGTIGARIAHGGQFSLKSWEDLFYGEKDGAVVIPFKSDHSDLLFHVNSDTLIAPVASPHMPLAGFNLPASQVQALQRWIDEGGRDDAGTIPFSTPTSGRITTVCASEDLLAVIDVESNFLMRFVPVGSAADPGNPFGAPHHVKADPAGEFFYVTLISSQELWKFSASTYELLGTVPIPFQPADIAFTGTGDTAYVTSFNSTSGLVSLVNTQTMQVLQSILTPFASNPHGIVLSHDRTHAFVTNAGSGNLTMINTADNSTSLIALDTLGNPFSSNVRPYLADLTPDDRYLFVTDYAQGAQNVYVIDLQTDPTKPSIVIPIGGRSVHVAVTPDGTKAFVCNLDLNSVHVIFIPGFTFTTIQNVGKQPHGVVFTPDGRTAYVTTENTLTPDPPHHPTNGSAGVSHVYVIDVPSLQITRSIEVGAFGQGLTFLP